MLLYNRNTTFSNSQQIYFSSAMNLHNLEILKLISAQTHQELIKVTQVQNQTEFATLFGHDEKELYSHKKLLTFSASTICGVTQIYF